MQNNKTKRSDIQTNELTKSKIGLLIGRFQPFHLGHLYLLKESFKYIDKLIIGIGSANISDENNPYTAKERRENIERIMEKTTKWSPDENLKDKVIKIIELDDFPNNDEAWFENVMEKLKKIESINPKEIKIIANDNWVSEIFRKKGFEIINIPFLKREIYEGTKIRKMMNSGNMNWKKLVA